MPKLTHSVKCLVNHLTHIKKNERERKVVAEVGLTEIQRGAHKQDGEEKTGVFTEWLITADKNQACVSAAGVPGCRVGGGTQQKRDWKRTEEEPKTKARHK